MKNSDLQVMGNKPYEAYNCSSLLRGEIFLLMCRGVEPRPELRRWSWKSGKAKVTAVAGKHTREGRTEQKEDPGDLQSPPQVFG